MVLSLRRLIGIKAVTTRTHSEYSTIEQVMGVILSGTGVILRPKAEESTEILRGVCPEQVEGLGMTPITITAARYWRRITRDRVQEKQEGIDLWDEGQYDDLVRYLI